MFLISTRNFPPELGGMQNLMEGLSNALLNHGPVKVYAESHNDSENYDQNSNLNIERVAGLKIFRKYRKANLVKEFLTSNEVRASFFDHWKSIENIEKNLLPRIYINGRKNLINRCLNNIIDNALKYGNKVQIKLSKENTNILIIIDDDGFGIPKEEYENVFKPFYKIDKGRADSKSSVGLGLSIASDIVRSHGGNIVLDKSKMNGLSVKIFLPV